MILGWAISFSVFALVAAALGFSHAAASTSVIAKICFALCVLSSLVRAGSAGERRARATTDVIRAFLARAGVGEVSEDRPTKGVVLSPLGEVGHGSSVSTIETMS
jgi:uncharacterized membrane protein YtjA (UPF0391 family)